MELLLSRGRRLGPSSIPCPASGDRNLLSAPTGRMTARCPRSSVLRAAGAGPGAPVGVAWSAGRRGAGVRRRRWWPCPGDGVDAVRRVLERAAAAAGLVVGARARTRAGRGRAAGAVVLGRRRDPPAAARRARTDDPALVWAAARPASTRCGRPRTGQLDLLSGGGSADEGDPADADDPVRPDGYLRPGWAETGPPTLAAAAALGRRRARRAGRSTQAALAGLPDGRRCPAPPAPGRCSRPGRSRPPSCSRSSSACRGLPLDRADGDRADRGAGRAAAGRRGGRGGQPGRAATTSCATWCPAPRTSTCATRPRCASCSPGSASTCPTPGPGGWSRSAAPTRWSPRCSTWRKAERIATTYGYGWLDRDVGADGRLRGVWTGCDGAAGRMTASAGLHNLPAELRPAVAAEPGHVLVRADLGQVEPRVLAAVSGDDALARATADDDLYAPVAARLGVRPADRQGRRAGGDVRPDLRRGRRGAARAGAGLPGRDGLPAGRRRVRRRRATTCATYGGRRVPDVAAAGAGRPGGRRPRAAGSPATPWCRARRPSCSRCGRSSVRAGAARTGAEIVLCLHDELLVHVPEARSRRGGRPAARRAGRPPQRWAAGSGVRFVADVVVVQRWSDAKG